MPRNLSLGRLIAAGLMFGALATACSSSSDCTPGSEGCDAATTVAGNPGDTGDTDTTEPGTANVLLESDGSPEPGGSLVYALASETDGYDPTKSRWATDGTIVAMTIFDPLAAYDEDGHWAPYLAESFEPDADFTTWTITLRPDITFHDGTALDSAAVRQVLEAHLQSPLTRPSLAPIESIENPDSITLVVEMAEPWAAFPVALTGQAGVIPAPSQMADPDGGREPVGTGPFRLVSWEPDKELIVERNPDYWQTDADGEQLPYLDEIEFRPLTDDSARMAAIQTDDVDMTHTSSIPSIEEFRKMAAAGDLQYVEQKDLGEVSFVMLNTAVPPFDDPIAREALATGTNAEAYVEVIADGATTPADSVFRPGSRWYSADAGYPEYDPNRARDLVAQYEEEHGEPLAFTFSVLATPSGAQAGQFLQSMWQEIGMEVDIQQADAGTFIVNGAMGIFQATQWGQFGSPDPDYEHVWWNSASSSPVGELSLNFPRNEDPELDAALARARSTDDDTVRAEAYVTVQQRLSETLPYVFLDYPVPVRVAQNRVRGVVQGELPGGGASIPLGGPGSFSLVGRLTQTWVTE